MRRSDRHEHESDAAEPLIAYVYGNPAPDFAAIAACGFEIVCLDSTACWFRESMIADAAAHGLRAFAFPMAYIAPSKAH